jgi:PAS domain S-box-containing protein
MDAKTFSSLRSLSLLYAEDDRETREELAMMLEPWVSRLYLAADGREALDLFVRHQPDIVLTDIQMPRMNGLVMSDEIRRRVPGQAIVVVSAYNDVEYLFRAIELGIDHYLTKPVNVEHLLLKLDGIAQGMLAIREREANRTLLEQYRLLVDQSAIVCKLDLDGRITYGNDRFCEISGHPASELTGLAFADLGADEASREVWNKALIQARGGQVWAGVIRNQTRDGRPYVFESSVVPIRDTTGAVSELVTLNVDITPVYENFENLVASLNRSNLSLQEQRHFLNEYKRALELGSHVCVVDCEFRIISVNRQLAGLLGYDLAELQGRAVTDISPDLVPDHCLADMHSADRGQARNRIFRFLQRTGEECQLSVGCIGIHDVDGAVNSLILVCQDVTESLRLSRDIVETQRELLYMMGDVVENRSEETAQHVKRVALVAKFLALKIGLARDRAEMIETTAPMHDIGKVGIRDAILHKPGKLTPEEYDEMKHHAEIGHAILCKVERPLIGLAATIAYEHHEHYDGSGYPRGLVGEAISIEARIVAVADVLDALLSARGYKHAWEPERVRDYFLTERGQQFDPRLTDLVLGEWDNLMALREGRLTI